MGYLKQAEVKGKRAKQGASRRAEKSELVNVVVTGPDVKGYVSTPALQHEINYVSGLSGIEESMDALTKVLRDYTSNAAQGENKLAIFTGPEGSGYHPVLIALDPCSESTEQLIAVGERIAAAFERIADALTAEHKTPPTEERGPRRETFDAPQLSASGTRTTS